jgi:hypothetical protein
MGRAAGEGLKVQTREVQGSTLCMVCKTDGTCFFGGLKASFAARRREASKVAASRVKSVGHSAHMGSQR